MNKKCKFCGGRAHVGDWCGSEGCLRSAYRRMTKDYKDLLKMMKLKLGK